MKSHYIDEHGAKVDYNPRLRGGPGSTGEALFRTHLIQVALTIASDLRRIADALEIPPEALDQIEQEARKKS